MKNFSGGFLFPTEIMNSKANKTEIQFPPLLNMQDDRPSIHNDFRSVEAINAPLLNGMISPLWETSYEDSFVVDKYDNKYKIEDNKLLKNGEELFSVNNKHFSKTDVTDEYGDYIAFDFDSEGNLAFVDYDTTVNKITLKYKNDSVELVLGINEVLIASRVRVFNDDTAIGVFVYKDKDDTHFAYLKTGNAKQVIVNNLTWNYVTPRVNSTSAYTIYTREIENPNPIIYISNPLENVYAVSVVSNQNEVLYTREEGYFTFVDNNGSIIYGSNWKPENKTITGEVENTTITTFIFNTQKTSTQKVVYCWFDSTSLKWFYANTDTEVEGQGSPYFRPGATQGMTDDLGHELYFQASYLIQHKIDISYDDDYGYNITANGESFTDKNKTIETEHTYYDPNTDFEDSIEIDFDGDIYTVNPDVYSYEISKTTKTTSTGSFLIAPNVFIDDGSLRSFYTFTAHPNSNSWNTALNNSGINYICESGRLESIGENGYSFTVTEAHIVDAYSRNYRSNSISNGQNFWASEAKYSYNTRTPYNLYVSNNADTFTSSAHIVEYVNSNTHDMLYYSGTFPNSDYTFFPTATAASEDVAWFECGGFRTTLPNTHWNLLFYVDENASVGCQGISWSEDAGKQGTLVTEWNAIADGSYIVGNDDFVIYRDKNDRYWKISIEEEAVISSVLHDRYILVNTTSYWNLYDAKLNRKFHYANDYNNRDRFGKTRLQYRDSLTYYNEKDSRAYASACNSNYETLPRLPVVSYLPSAIHLSHLDDSYFYSYANSTSESRQVQPVDVFLQQGSTSSARYLFSVEDFSGNKLQYRNNDMIGLLYAGSSTYYSTDIFSKFVNGAGNNDFVLSNYSSFPLIYNAQQEPLFLYSAIGEIENVKHFFVIQGQYYAVIGEKLYAMLYSNGIVSQMDAMIDIRDLSFIGNTPSIAFFVNPKTRLVYSFTGDANLQQIFDCSKYEFCQNDGGVDYWYDESTQSIYVATTTGLIVFGPLNTYFLDDFTEVENIQFVNGHIYITHKNGLTDLTYYENNNEPRITDFETSFYGLGARESTTIDRWNITLYDKNTPETEVEFCIRSLTDVSSSRETKKLKINKTDWDEWSKSILISYTPKLIKGQGLRLGIKTSSSIQSIVPHIMDNKTGTTTRFDT